VLLVLVPLVRAEIGMLLQRMPLLADVLAARVSPWLAETLGIEVALDLASLKGMLADNIEELRGVGTQLLERNLAAIRQRVSGACDEYLLGRAEVHCVQVGQRHGQRCESDICRAS
jgi:hypothetical protein